jgi:hypothetical protein
VGAFGDEVILESDFFKLTQGALNCIAIQKATVDICGI